MHPVPALAIQRDAGGSAECRSADPARGGRAAHHRSRPGKRQHPVSCATPTNGCTSSREWCSHHAGRGAARHGCADDHLACRADRRDGLHGRAADDFSARFSTAWTDAGQRRLLAAALPRMARQVNRVLTGGRPGDLPVEVVVRPELVINQRDARAWCDDPVIGADAGGSCDRVAIAPQHRWGGGLCRFLSRSVGPWCVACLAARIGSHGDTPMVRRPSGCPPARRARRPPAPRGRVPPGRHRRRRNPPSHPRRHRSRPCRR